MQLIYRDNYISHRRIEMVAHMSELLYRRNFGFLYVPKESHACQVENVFMES